MAISRKVDQVIQKGGEVKADSKSSREFKVLSQTLRSYILEQVDADIASRPVLISRNAWIQEAIIEKLERTKNAHNER